MTTDLDWNSLRHNHYPAYKVENEQRPLIHSIRDTPEWETVVNHYNIESWVTVTTDERDFALHTLSSITGLEVTAVAFHATREARSRELAYEYEVGLG